MDLKMDTPPFIVKLSDNGHSTRHLHATRHHGYRLKRAKQLLEGLKKDFEKKAAEMESKEHKNRAMAEKARQKAESIVADMGDAKQGRLKAEVEIIKIRGTWVFISLLIFLITFVGTSNEHPMQNLMQSFNKTLSNFVPDSEMKTNPMAQNKRHRQMLKKDYKQGDARMKQEAATQAKIAADRKDAEEAKQKAQEEKDPAQKAKKEAELLARQKADGEARMKQEAATQAKIAADRKDAEEAKQKAQAEKDAAQKAKKEAELLARQKADRGALRREARAFQTEHNIIDEILLFW
jgi:hypothetical protein